MNESPRARDERGHGRVAARILVVDDDSDACDILGQILSAEGHRATTETSPNRALGRIAEEDFDLVLTDVSMAEMNGLELCRRVLALRPQLPVVLVTGRGNMDTAIAALRIGARDFLRKPVDAATLVACVARVVSGPAPGSTRSATELPPHAVATGIFGESAAAKTLHAFIKNLQDSLVSVLIQGETGTGKELVARAIHASSRVSSGPFIALNCAAMPSELLENELFGHARGAFTGAGGAVDGLLLQANGGTLLLDEIGELAYPLQAKLLRAMQERVIRPLGSAKESRFDCRILAATNRDLEVEVAQKRFREDLFYRLDVVRIVVPPLRVRGRDILLLASYFLARSGMRVQRSLRLSEAAAARLLAYPWPGNVRELENCIERTTALCRSDEIDVEDLPDKIRSFDVREVPTYGEESEPPEGADAEPHVMSLSELERHHVLRAVKLVRGNRTRAAELLGIDRRTLYRRLQQYGELPAADPSDSE